MTLKYDNKHKVSNLAEKIYLKLTKIEEIKYHISKNFSLFIKKIDPYKILKKINSLTYKLKLPSNMFKIHSIISMIYLKQTKSNPFDQEIPSSTFIIVQKRKEYVVKKIIQKKNETK